MQSLNQLIDTENHNYCSFSNFSKQSYSNLKLKSLLHHESINDTFFINYSLRRVAKTLVGKFISISNLIRRVNIDLAIRVTNKWLH